MRAMIIPVVTAALLASACGGGGDATSDGARRAIDDVVRETGYVHSWVKDREPGERECEIGRGGPAPLPGDDGYFSGLCRWDAERRDGSWEVVFTETWPCGLDGRDPCAHSWRYRVAADRSVSLIEEDGPIPPQLWE